MKDAWEQNSSELKDIQAKAKKHLFELHYPGCWISFFNVEFFEENFIFSDRGFHHNAEECSSVANLRVEITKVLKGEQK